ncbi:MAG: hypothetical protein K2W80_06985, partial [Burkholderiales bacterium]|nr:hypothetical protein [Burkholderiales bacterium]
MATACDSTSNTTRPRRLALAALLLAAATLALPQSALADRGHRHFGHGHGGHGGHGWHGGPRFSIHLSSPGFHRPYFYAPPRVFYAPPFHHAPRVIYAPPVVYAP